jgi:Xaa-Pro dipeptidase
MLDMTFFYMTRLETGLFEGSVAVLRENGKVDVVASLLEEQSAKKGRFGLHIFKTDEERRTIVKKLLADVSNIGINGAELTYRGLEMIKKCSSKKTKYTDITKSVMSTRLVKDDTEIATMKKACQIASEVAEDIVDKIKVGVLEYEVAAEMCYMMQKKGATGPAFDSIVSFGKNSAEPHYTAGNAKLKKGDFVLLDFGALYKRYRSDITRTYFCGAPSAKQREMYNVVAKAQELAFKKIMVGEKASVPHNAADKYINSTKYKGKFTHGLGHGIGLATHDGGGLNPRADEIKLKEGMIFTVEPGIYLPGFGGVRIEDDIVVRKNGPEILTDASREIIAL